MPKSTEVGEHTPGPWIHVVNDPVYGSTGDCYVWTSKGPGYGVLADTSRGPFARREANARLISAAPDLYEALQDLLEARVHLDAEGYTEVKYADTESGKEAVKKAYAALAKARGEVANG